MSRSRAKRASRPACRRLSIGSFSATSRLKAPSARRASHTSAMPPAPSSRISSYGPTRAPGCRPLAAGALASSAAVELRQAHQRFQFRCLRRSRQQRLAQRGGQIRMLWRSRPARRGAQPHPAPAPHPAAGSSAPSEESIVPSVCLLAYRLSATRPRESAAPSPSRAAPCVR